MGDIMTFKHLFLAAVFCGAVQGSARVVGAAELKAAGWPIPDVASARFLKERQSDLISELPGAETRQTAYLTPAGTVFNTLHAKGRLYGFYVDTDGKPPMEYTLLDLNGDGVFEHKSSKENWATPSYLLSEAPTTE